MIELPEPGAQAPGTTLELLADPDGGIIRRSVVEPGLRVLTEQSPTGRAVTLGVAVPVGSRDEEPRYAGASHFLEHLLFKGTARRTALQISAEIDAVGGELNAFTGKEYTCFYARVLDRDLELALDVLLDMITSSVLAAADVDSEREVVIEEIAMHDDDPSGVAHELFATGVFAGTPLAAPIIGTVASIGAMPADDVRRHYHRWYRPNNLSVVAAGRLDHDVVVAAVERAVAAAGLADLTDMGEPVARRARDATAGAGPDVGAAAADSPVWLRRARDTEQVNVVLGTTTMGRTDPRRYALGVFNAAIGGGMSSRLFQEVREIRGLAYAVQSYTSLFSDVGAFGVFAGTSPAKLDDTLGVIDSVLGQAVAEGFADEEIERGRGQLRGGLVLSQEESSSRMVSLAEAEVITGRLRPVAESLASIDAVTPAQVREIAEELWSGQRHIAVVGPAEPGAVGAPAARPASGQAEPDGEEEVGS